MTKQNRKKRYATSPIDQFFDLIKTRERYASGIRKCKLCGEEYTESCSNTIKETHIIAHAYADAQKGNL